MLIADWIKRVQGSKAEKRSHTCPVRLIARSWRGQVPNAKSTHPFDRNKWQRKSVAKNHLSMVSQPEWPPMRVFGFIFWTVGSVQKGKKGKRANSKDHGRALTPSWPRNLDRACMNASSQAACVDSIDPLSFPFCARNSPLEYTP